MVTAAYDNADRSPEGAETTQRRRRIAKRIAKIFGGFLLLIFIAWLILFITKGRFLKSQFEQIVSRQIEREVKVAGDFQFYFAPFNVKLLAEGLTVANPAWARSRQRHFFAAKLIDTRISTWSLVFGPKRRVNRLLLDGGRIDLAWEAGARRNTWTFGDPNRPAEPFELPDIRTAVVSGSRVAYRDPLLFLTADVGIETIRATNTTLPDTIRVSGGGTLRRRPFTLTGQLLSPNQAAAGGETKIVLAARADRTFLDLTGTLPGATVIEGADLRLKVRGPNIARLFDFLGVAVPDTRAYRLASKLTRRNEEWRFTQLNGVFGESDIGGRLTVSMPRDRLMMIADLQTRTLDIIDAGPFIGYDPEALDARGVAAASGQGGGRLLPDAPLRTDALARFDARVNYRIARVRAESFPISDIALRLDLERSLLKLSPVTFAMAGGRVAADIAINARTRPVVTRYDIRLSPTPMGTLLARWGVEDSGTSGTIKARVEMTGEGDTVRESLASSDGRIAIVVPQGSLWTRNVQLSEIDIGTFVTKLFEDKLKEPVRINCGLVAFTVRDGIAAADPILIDTRKNVILGRGGFSFKNETLDLRIRADGKKISVFSAQSPVGVGGSFASPKIDVISPQLVARGAAGLGLALAATPLAGVLAFVDVGDAKAASCGPVLAGATSAAQRTEGGKPRDDVGRGTTAKSEDGKRSPQKAREQRKKFLGIF